MGEPAGAEVDAGRWVAAVVGGWGVGQYPWVLVDHATIAQSAGAPATMVGLLVAFGVAASWSCRR